MNTTDAKKKQTNERIRSISVSISSASQANDSEVVQFPHVR